MLDDAAQSMIDTCGNNWFVPPEFAEMLMRGSTAVPQLTAPPPGYRPLQGAPLNWTANGNPPQRPTQTG